MADHSPQIQYLPCGGIISTPFVFQTVDVQNAANSVYVQKSTSDGLYVASNPVAPRTYNFKTYYERMQYITGRQALGRAAPAYVPTLYYAYFFTTGSATWTAPTSCQNPVAVWLVGGGGGGGGAFDNAGAGGGAGGSFSGSAYNIFPGRTYTLVVGEGGTGGSGLTSIGQPSVDTPGTAGGESSFDTANISGSGLVAPGGLGGYNSRSAPGGAGVAGTGASPGTAATGGNGGGGGGDGGGGGGALTSGLLTAGGSGIDYVFPGVASGNVVTYGEGGDGGVNGTLAFGASGQVNTGTGGGGGGAASATPVSLTQMGGNGGSGLVVLKYFA